MLITTLFYIVNRESNKSHQTKIAHITFISEEIIECFIEI